MQKINHINGSLYCSVDIAISGAEYYANYEEYFDDNKDDIIKSCKDMEYSEKQIEAVLSHYRTHWGLSPVEWGTAL